MRRCKTAFSLLAMVALVLPQVALAQATSQGFSRRLDGEIAYLTFSWGSSFLRAWSLDPEIGIGLLEQKTFSPSGEDFTAAIHVGVTSRLRLAGSVGAELGLRLGGGELSTISCSGCGLSGVVAGTGALFAGSGRWQLGTRLMFGFASGESFGAWSPVVVRFRF